MCSTMYGEVTTTFDLVNVTVDYVVQLAFSLAAGNPNFNYGVRAHSPLTPLIISINGVFP